jgi:hypothetical protein
MVEWRAIASAAMCKLDMIDAASRRSDLRAPPGKRLEAQSTDWVPLPVIRSREAWRRAVADAGSRPMAECPARSLSDCSPVDRNRATEY